VTGIDSRIDATKDIRIRDPSASADHLQAALKSVSSCQGKNGKREFWRIVNANQASSNPVREQMHTVDHGSPVYKLINVEQLKKAAPAFTITFTEDRNGFYINGPKFAADAPPMTTTRVGAYQNWRIINQTGELHPFHIHPVHFLTYAETGIALAHPVWLDTGSHDSVVLQKRHSI